MEKDRTREQGYWHRTKPAFAQAAFWGAVLIGIWALLTVPIIIATSVEVTSGEVGDNQEPPPIHEIDDQGRFHRPTIEQFIAQWPHPDISDYKSATGPGYHLLIAATAVVLGLDSSTDLRWIHFGYNFVIICTLFAILYVIGDGPIALLCGLPLVCLDYVIGSSVWLMTDNLAFMLVVSAMVACVLGRRSGKWLALAGVTSALAIFVRQIHLWLLIPVTVSSAIHLRNRAGVKLCRLNATQWSWIAIAWVTPLATFVLLWILWNGATPPAFQGKHDFVMQPVSLLYTLSLIGMYGIFLLRLRLSILFKRWLRASAGSESPCLS